MNVLGAIAAVVGGIAFLWAWGSGRGEVIVVFDLVALLGMALVVVGVVMAGVVHEGVHALAMLPFGAQPRFGATRIHGAPAWYCTAEGHRFTKAQFGFVALAPTVVVSALIWALAVQPWMGMGVVVVGAIHLSGCGGDWVMLAVAARQPRGTLVEDRAQGMRFHRI